MWRPGLTKLSCNVHKATFVEKFDNILLFDIDFKTDFQPC